MLSTPQSPLLENIKCHPSDACAHSLLYLKPSCPAFTEGNPIPFYTVQIAGQKTDSNSVFLALQQPVYVKKGKKEWENEGTFSFFFNLYWNIVDLRCVSFRCQERDSMIHMYIHILLKILFHYMLLQDIEYSSCASWWPRGEVSACNTGDAGSIPGSAMSPGEGTHSSILAWEIPWAKEPGRL